MIEIVITKSEKIETFESAYETLSDTGNEKGGGPIYGYVKKPVIQKVETVILKQQVIDEENFDLAKVIKAVNNL